MTAGPVFVSVFQERRGGGGGAGGGTHTHTHTHTQTPTGLEAPSTNGILRLLRSVIEVVLCVEPCVCDRLFTADGG